MLIAVIDGQGGGIGRAIVEKIKKELCISNRTIFSNTVLLIDIDMWREKNYSNKFFEKANSYFKNLDIKLSALGCLNLIIDNFKEINLKYNYTQCYGSSLTCSLKKAL